MKHCVFALGFLVALTTGVSAQEGTIYFERESTGTLYSMDAATRSISAVAEGRKIGSFAEGVTVRRPDGTVLVVTGAEAQVADLPAKAVYVDVSGDGSMVLFLLRGTLVMAKADGSDQQLLLERAQRGWWSPLESYVVYFYRDRPDNVEMYDIYRINIHTGEERLVLGGYVIAGFDAPFSPDGTKLFVTNCGDGAFCLKILDLRSGTVEQVGPEGNRGIQRPAWSPDGQQILYAIHGGVGGLHVLEAATGESRELVPGRSDTSPYVGVWSPDGAYVAFSAADYSTGRADRLFMVKADGSAAPEELAEGFRPTWVAQTGRSTGVTERSWGQVKLETR